jgi:hypothetical protein
VSRARPMTGPQSALGSRADGTELEACDREERTGIQLRAINQSLGRVVKDRDSALSAEQCGNAKNLECLRRRQDLVVKMDGIPFPFILGDPSERLVRHPTPLHGFAASRATGGNWSGQVSVEQSRIRYNLRERPDRATFLDGPLDRHWTEMTARRLPPSGGRNSSASDPFG